MGDTDRRWGNYEYSYSFWREDAIINLYPWLQCLIKPGGFKTHVFEIRTNFKLMKAITSKATDGDDDELILGSERFAVAVYEDDDASCLVNTARFRVQDDYCMSEAEMQSLFGDAMDFARRNAKANAVDSVFISFVVGLDVRTVQREGEPMDAAIGRAMRPECLIPLYLWPVVPKGTSIHWKKPGFLRYYFFVIEMERVRVQDEAAVPEEVCPVCSCDFVVGAQISFLPCNHACHSLCVFNWLIERRNSSCPACRQPIPP